MEEKPPVEPIQERFREAGNLLLQLAENPDVASEIAASVRAEDPERFRAAVGRAMPEVPLPPDKCDPYVRSVAILSEPGHFECTWTAPATLTIQNANLPTGTPSPPFLPWLQKQKLLKCKWVPAEPAVIDVFVRGVCPPGTF